MEPFIKNIYFVLDVIKRKPGKQEIVDHNIIEKQYLTYYLYRILSKYEGMMKHVVSYKRIRDIYTILRVPENYQQTTYPLAHKMTYNDKLLDLCILGILDIFREVDETLKQSIGNKQYEELVEFISEKNLEMILLDLKVLQKLFPNLGVTGVKPYLYEFLNQEESTPITPYPNTAPPPPPAPEASVNNVSVASEANNASGAFNTPAVSGNASMANNAFNDFNDFNANTTAVNQTA